jgi:hypothetical protein
VISKLFLVSLFSCALATQVASANITKEPGLAERIASSDVVVVASMTGSHPSAAGTENSEERVELKVLSVIKGLPEATIYLDKHTVSIEWAFSCCRPGQRYLLFLKKIGAGVYTPYFGMFGIYELK